MRVLQAGSHAYVRVWLSWVAPTAAFPRPHPRPFLALAPRHSLLFATCNLQAGALRLFPGHGVARAAAARTAQRRPAGAVPAGHADARTARLGIRAGGRHQHALRARAVQLDPVHSLEVVARLIPLLRDVVLLRVGRVAARDPAALAAPPCTDRQL